MVSDRLQFFLRFISSLLLAGVLSFSTGCDGCRNLFSRRSEENLDEAQKKKPKQVEPFESKELKVLPTDESIVLQGVKPGHWFSAQQQLKSNKDDFYGALDCLSSGRSSNQPLPLQNSNYRLRTNRLVSLPKGQNKSFELSYFAPTTSTSKRQVWLHSNLRSPTGGVNHWSQTQIGSKLAAYQTYCVVLSRRPDSYGYLKTLHSIKPPSPNLQMGGITTDYIVTLANTSNRIPVPSWPLMWTIISYVIMDDFDPNTLTSTQRESMLDWLHWGGQLIISGPSSLDALKGSFLADYLPAQANGIRKMNAEDVADLNKYWTVPSLRNGKIDVLKINPAAAPELLKLELNEGSKFVPGSHNLVAERRIGRGRVVTTSFSLTSRPVINWRGFDNFFNGCLMRRPGRRYSYSDESGLSVNWITKTQPLQRARYNFDSQAVPTASNEPLTSRSDLPTLQPRRFPVEALINSKLRYFSRDAANDGSTGSKDDKPIDVVGYGYGQQSGVAGWNDFSSCSAAARKSLQKAAGISVPKRSFILMTLALYLFILVPANWALFRGIGRVEWAWGAVPVIAIASTYFVVQLAQLDIGFARSRTEIAILETQPDFTRAHLTRYTGLYSSLSTGYDLSFENESALALPFGADRVIEQPSFRDVAFLRVDKKNEASRLDQFSVSSNSTEMVHSEESYELGNNVRLTEPAPGLFRIVNDTDLELQDVGVVRLIDGEVQVAWIGELPPKAAIQAKFISFDVDQPMFSGWSKLEAKSNDEIQVHALLRLALTPSRLNEGDVRLAGWCDQQMPGLTIQPAASQQTYRTVLVANLKYGSFPKPQSDLNTERDINLEPDDDRAN